MDSALRTIDAALMNVQQLLGSYNLRFIDNQGKLHRLEKALMELTETKTALDTMKSAYLQPEFTSETFAGKNSNQLNDFRHDTLADSFKQLTETQMEQRIEDIQRQITIYQGEISNIKASISSFESQQKELHLKREREIANKES
ncbi:DUF5082 family protein [Oceanobacillus sp. CFH 90083]|uniref:YwqH-like family protein n=1 Tax=Oceanobacillus sp. CFH 90083 TaxID=2592336 RepID=UPI00128E8616|nr:DUF5082 family protein [Oceanobacillus sp. CFH 90083]